MLLGLVTGALLLGPPVVTGAILLGRAPAPPAELPPVPLPRTSIALGRPAAPERCDQRIAALAHPDHRRRERAADALAAAPCDPRRAVPALVRGLQDPEVNVRWAVNRALCAYGPQARAAVPALVRALEDPATKEWAPTVLIEIGPDAIPELTRALADRRPHVRRAAAFTLGGLGTPARSATPQLLRLARRDSSWLVRRTARWAAASVNDRLPTPPAALQSR